ncbi:MAG TPA: hypothetical protein VJA22_01325 [Patescibacteria group bacterium]|nr:hypothetical protein [Patescibacteria group bacterium]
MYIENTFIRRYYHVSLFFIFFSLVEAVLYLTNNLGGFNYVYLLFEIIWLVFTVVMLIYLLSTRQPRGLLSFPIAYILYFVLVYIYTEAYERGILSIDRDGFVRNNGLILLGFVIVFGLIYWRSHKKFFTKVM